MSPVVDMLSYQTQKQPLFKIHNRFVFEIFWPWLVFRLSLPESALLRCLLTLMKPTPRTTPFARISGRGQLNELEKCCILSPTPKYWSLKVWKGCNRITITDLGSGTSLRWAHVVRSLNSMNGELHLSHPYLKSQQYGGVSYSVENSCANGNGRIGVFEGINPSSYKGLQPWRKLNWTVKWSSAADLVTISSYTGW